MSTAIVMFFALACVPAISTTTTNNAPQDTPKPDTVDRPPIIDTTHLIEAPADYSRYNTPGACERAMEHTKLRILRQVGRDTVEYAPEFDTLPTQAVEVARTCAAKFTVDNVQPEQLLFFMRLSLAIGNDRQAALAVERQLTMVADTAEQGMVLARAIETYLTAKPLRLKAAEALLKRIDALGNTARIGRLQAHFAMLGYYAVRFQPDRIEREAKTIIAFSNILTKNELDQWGPQIAGAFMHLSTAKSYRETPLAGLQTLQEGIAVIGNIRGGQVQRSLRVALQGLTAVAQQYGQPAATLIGHYFYNAGNATTRPTPGKISLFVTVDHNCAEFCYPNYAVLNRFNNKFSKAGLEITLIARTMGFSRNSGVQAPAEEVEAIRKYFLDERKLPVTLVVQETPFTIRPDGLRVNGQIQFEIAYPDAHAVLIDRAGKIRWLGSVDIAREAMVRVYIEKMIAE